MDFHPEGHKKLSIVCERYIGGEFELVELQERLNSLLALLPNDIAIDLQRLLEQVELIRFTQLENTHMQSVKPLLKSFLLNHGVRR